MISDGERDVTNERATSVDCAGNAFALSGPEVCDESGRVLAPLLG